MKERQYPHALFEITPNQPVISHISDVDGFDFTLAWSPDEFKHRSGDDWEKGIYCFNHVEGHPDMLMAWVGGASARTVDCLQDEEE